jgi:hypothetical protein
MCMAAALVSWLTPLYEWVRLWLGPKGFIDLGLGVGVLSLLSVLGLPYFIAKLPVDYFVREQASGRAGVGGWLVRLVRNIAGALLLVAGIAMLVLPGQGLLTILVAVVCLDFPSKRRFERKLLARPAVARSVNALRRRLGQPPLDLGWEGKSQRNAQAAPVHDSQQRR